MDIDINSFKIWLTLMVTQLAKKRCVTCVITSDNICYLSYRWILSGKRISHYKNCNIFVYTNRHLSNPVKTRRQNSTIIEVGHLVILSFKSMTYAVVEATECQFLAREFVIDTGKRSDQAKLYNDVRLSPVSLKMSSNTSAR